MLLINTMEHEKHKRKLNKLNINYVIPVVNNNLTKGQQLYTPQQLKEIVKLEKTILRKEKKVYTTIGERRGQELSASKVTRNQISNHNNNINYQFCKNFKKFIKIFPKSVSITNATLKHFMFWLYGIFIDNFYQWSIRNGKHCRKLHKLIKIKLSNMLEKTDFTRFFHKLIMSDLWFIQSVFPDFKDVLYCMPVRTQKILLTLIIDQVNQAKRRGYPCIKTIMNHLISYKSCNIPSIKKLLKKLGVGESIKPNDLPQTDWNTIREYTIQVLQENPEQWKQLQNGNNKSLPVITDKVIKLCSGNIDPKLVQYIIKAIRKHKTQL